MQFKKLFFAAAAVSGVFAATSNPICSSSLVVTNQTVLDDISSCQTFDGSITIDPSFGVVTLNGIQEITGDLIVVNSSSLTSLSAPDLETLGGRFDLEILTVLSTLSFPQLTSVGSIYWLHLAALSSIQFNNVVTKANSITISDTGLTSLEGINVQDVDTFDINNNRYLNEVNVALKTVSQSLDVSFNAQQVSASFPALQWANNITFRDVSSISLPNITTVNASAGFINNTIFGLALPQLKTVGGSLAIVSNNQLSNVSFPVLSTIGGGFQIANNTKLLSILGFPNVKSVGGAIDFTGNFTNADLPALNLVKGGVDIESSSQQFNCSAWNQAHADGDIQGDSYVCKAASVSTSVAIHATTGPTSGSVASAEATSTTSSHGGAVPLAMEYTSLFGALAAFVFQFV